MKCCLKTFYLELWWPLSSEELNHLCNFGRVHHEGQCCEIILNLDQWVRRYCFKTFLIQGSGGIFWFGGVGPFVQFW